MIAALFALTAAVLVPPVDAGFDYQIGGDYPLPPGVTVVVRDASGRAPAGVYAICYVNAFQTQPGARWPRELVLGEDPAWPGERALDISTARKRDRIFRRIARIVARCAAKGFEAVELDNLDSWTRFTDAPFDRRDAVAHARRLIRRAHRLGLAVGQKNAPQLAGRRIGFDFAIAEECARYRECGRYRAGYGDLVLDVEYRRRDFRRACRVAGDRISVVFRDRDVSRPRSSGYRYAAC